MDESQGREGDRHRPGRLRRVGAESRQAGTRNLHVVPHTHWDREWYQTFAGYRNRLIPLVEGLMDLLEENPEFRSFTFDGQVAPIDDYLATLDARQRRVTEPRLRKLIKDGRIQIGPWYTAQDFLLVSGETTLRNIQLGMRRARGYGFCVDVAYCPDQFGLPAQLPKILNHAGITRLIGERGMKPSLPWYFRWRTADGSQVDVYNIRDHYGGGRMTAEAMRRAVRERGGTALILSGDDHTVPQLDLLDRTRRAGGRMSSLGEFWATLPSFDATPLYEGEIRSAGRHNLLPNVVSNRVDQRLETAAAERTLERYAEPLAAFALPRYPRGLVDEAWHGLILNAAHDSACATGIDEVTRQVRVRARESLEIAEGIAAAGLRELARKLDESGEYVWNPSNFERDVVIPDRDGTAKVARAVPPLGWARLQTEEAPAATSPQTPPAIRFTDESDTGDTYTFQPGAVGEHAVTLPVRVEQRTGEPFQRVSVAWRNESRDHRVRMVLALPDEATETVADTAFGTVTRPAIAEVEFGADHLNGYPASRFIVAGGLAILLDRTAEYELLPDTNEIAITMVRSHGKLSTGGGPNRGGAAGPMLDTHDTQMQGDIEWNLAVMPWPHAAADALPWREWESFMLPMRRFESRGGGELPSRGTYFVNAPQGVLSAVVPGTVRSFEPIGAQRIIEKKLVLRAPQKELRRGVA